MKKLTLSALAAMTLSGCLMHEERHYTPGRYPVTKDDVVAMTRSGVSEDRILSRIHEQGVSHRATADDLVEMQNAGVTSRVMAGFAEAPVRDPRPPVERRTSYYYDPLSEPVVNFGIGVLTGYLLWRHFR